MKKILALTIVAVILASSFSAAAVNKKVESKIAFSNSYQKNGFPFIDTILQKLKTFLSKLFDLVSQKNSGNHNNNEDDRNNNDDINLAFEKRVRKKGSTIWKKQINIGLDEEVEFGLTIYNLNKLFKNCEKVEGIVTDTLPPYLLYTKGSAYFLIGKGETWIYAGVLKPVEVKPSVSADKGETIKFICAPLEKTSLIETIVFSDAVQQMPDWEHGMIVFSSQAIQTGQGVNTAELKAEFDGTHVELQDTAAISIG